MKKPPLHNTTFNMGVNRAFTLVEMLMVISIIALLITVAVPISRSVIQANQLSMATQLLVDKLNNARQNALAKNRVVEVLFYKCTIPERMDGTLAVVAIQSFIFDETNKASTPIGEIQYLPESVVISDDQNLSSLIQESRVKNTWTDDDPQRELPRGVSTDYVAYKLSFRPDGSTDLGAGNWFVTVHGINPKVSPPPNYSTVHLDPYNGSLRLYRPG